jgi:hypothetical protein
MLPFQQQYRHQHTTRHVQSQQLAPLTRREWQMNAMFITLSSNLEHLPV